MAKKIAVVTYDSDAPACRNLFINQADSKAIGTSEVDLLAKQINKTGEIAILSAAASATNQNAWIGFMKQQLKKYPNMKLVDVVYGNDDPTISTQVAQGLLQKYPNLKGIISPTTVGIAAAAAVLDTPKYRGKVKLTGLGTPNSLRKYVNDGTIEAFELWNPADLGYLAAYAAVNYASGTITGKAGQTFKAGKLGTFKVGAKQTGPARPAVRVQQGEHRASSTSRTSRGRAGHGRHARRYSHDRPQTPSLSLEHASKSFGAIQALDDVSIDLYRGRGPQRSSARTAPASPRW